MEKDYKLLKDSTTLLIQPELAKIIGLNEAIILQQIHYWIENSKAGERNFKIGRYWVYNTYEEWQKQFPFWSKNTIIRTLKSLDQKNILITGNFNKKNYDKTIWYTIDYKKLKVLLTSADTSCTQNELTDNPDWVEGCTQNGLTNTINYNKISTKNSFYNTHSEEMSEFDFGILFNQLGKCYMELTDTYESMMYSLEEYKDIFTCFYRCYLNNFGTHHPKLSNENIKSVIIKLPYVALENGNIVIDVDGNISMIDYYFDQDFGYGCNYSILHYVSGEIRKYAYYKTLH